jgi:hypothetical protein
VACDGLPSEGDISVLKKGNRLFVHLLNLERWRVTGNQYAPTELAQWTIPRAEPLNRLAVTVRLPAGMSPKRARVVSPDFSDARPLDLRVERGKASFVVPRLELYSVVVLEP